MRNTLQQYDATPSDILRLTEMECDSTAESVREEENGDGGREERGGDERWILEGLGGFGLWGGGCVFVGYGSLGTPGPVGWKRELFLWFCFGKLDSIL
uniref:Uncharacterized protein n=1 Tax=Oryza glumipatula TaxID=40148 RepID=A0A0D9Y8V5_9ORYZ